MRTAAISDIHSNLEAFESVMSDISGQRVDQIISLGDNVGYGAQSDEIIVRLDRYNIQSVVGNHELAMLDKEYLSVFGPDPRKALKINKKNMSDKALKFISALPRCLVLDGCRFVHGVPPDTITRHIDTVPESMIINIMQRLKQKVSFVGHTHHLVIYGLDRGVLKKKNLLKCKLSLAKSRRYIINTGSVGQPRDGYNEAKYIIWDSDRYTIETRFVPYDYHKAAEKIREAGIPELYAAVLEKSKKV